MANVYGIYIKATGQLVYIGHTLEHISVRFNNHIVEGCRLYSRKEAMNVWHKLQPLAA